MQFYNLNHLQKTCFFRNVLSGYYDLCNKLEHIDEPLLNQLLHGENKPLNK